LFRRKGRAVLLYRIIQIQLPGLDQCHGCDRGDGLGDRAGANQGFGARRDRILEIRAAESLGIGESARRHHGDGDRRNLLVAHRVRDERIEPRLRRRCRDLGGCHRDRREQRNTKADGSS
jgi:hypothetical protein